MKLLFVVNPISGGVDKEPFLKKAKAICLKYGIAFEIFKTTGKNDLKNLKELLPKVNPTKVISVGGDGTTLFTSIALLNTNYPLGIIPLGSANGMATELFVNPDPIEAFKDILHSEVIEGLDMVVVNDEHYSIHIGDVGVNASIVESYEKDKNRGMATYAKYFLEELKQLKPFNFSITANGETIKSNGLMVGICNSRKYGTGIPLNIDGNPMDGKFEIVVIEKMNSNVLLKAGLSKFDESFHDSQNGISISTTKAKINFEETRMLQLDGEVIGEFSELNIEINPGAVRLITHNNNLFLKNNFK
jgi:diacylglycerol kinase family enzyme